MIYVFVWLFFLAGFGINCAVLARMDIARLDFLDGILIGHAYYILVPTLVFLLRGLAEVPELALSYYPFKDLGTTAILLGGMYLFPLLRLLLKQVPSHVSDRSDPRMVPSVIALFLVTAIASFALTGLAGGGHWQGNIDTAFANPAFLPIKYAANVARDAVFAVLLYRVAVGAVAIWSAVLVGIALSLFDVFTTFNRITAVYLLLMVLLLLKDRPWRMLLTGVASLSMLSVLSTLWPMFRGLATAQGYTLQSFALAWDMAWRSEQAKAGSLEASLNSVFESSNIVVLDWIVHNFGTLDRPYLAFAMFARPVTLLLPGALWPGRPENFGLSLGEAIAHIPSLALNSTLYGESYANFGWFWPLGLSAFVLLWHGVYRLIAPQSRVVQIMGAFAAIAMWRFDASFIGCAALLTGGMVVSLRLLRISRIKPSGRFYWAQRRA